MTWRELLGGEALREAVHEVDVPPPPLLSRLMAGIGAWTAGCFFLGSMLLLLEFINALAWASLSLFGGACLVFAVALRRRGEGVVAEQIGLVLLSTGLAAASAGIEDLVESNRLTAGAVSVLATVLVFSYRDAFARAWLTVLAIGGITLWMDFVIRGEDASTFMAAASMVVGAAATGAAWVGPLASMSRPVLRGAVLALLIANLSLFVDGDGTAPLLGWLEAVVLGALGAWLARDNRLRAGVVLVPLLLAAFGAPGVIAGALGVAVATWIGDRILLGVAATYSVGFVGWYYYDLDLDLWSKAGALAATGALCLGARAAMHHAFPGEGR